MAQHKASAITQLQQWFRRDIEEPSAEAISGPARLRVIVLLACVLGLDSADKATIGAVAVQLKDTLHASNTEIGLLVTASTVIAAVATLPFGILADRIHRIRLLAVIIVVWSIAIAVSGAADRHLCALPLQCCASTSGH